MPDESCPQAEPGPAKWALPRIGAGAPQEPGAWSRPPATGHRPHGVATPHAKGHVPSHTAKALGRLAPAHWKTVLSLMRMEDATVQ